MIIWSKFIWLSVSKELLHKRLQAGLFSADKIRSLSNTGEEELLDMPHTISLKGRKIPTNFTTLVQ